MQLALEQRRAKQAGPHAAENPHRTLAPEP